MKLNSWPVLVGTAVLVTAGVVIGIMFRLGSFKDVEIQHDQTIKTFHLLSRDHLGPYHKIAEVISEVETWARANGEPCLLTFGEYKDNPDTTDEDRLRSRGGCLLPSLEAVKALEGKIPEGMSLSSHTIENSLIAIFDGSPAIAPSKVYPEVFERMEQLGMSPAGSIFEIYEVLSSTEGRTKYIFSVEDLRRGK